MKKYLDPITKDKFISGDEYFTILNSKKYDKKLDKYNKPLDK